VTGPAFGGTGRGTGAPSRATGTRETVGAVLVVLAAGLALRLIIAQLIPGSGFDVDIGAFRYWASNLASNGPFGFYQRDFFHDYTPGYLYVLWAVGVVGNLLGGVGDLIKVPPILADLGVGWLAWSMVRELGARDRLALGAAFVAVVNPISWFDSVVWGQADSFGVVFVLLGLRELWRDRPERAAVFTVIAAIIKPQLGILIPLVAVVTIRRALWPNGGFGEAARTGRPIRILTTAAAGLITAWILCLPFGLSVIELSSQAPYIQSGLFQQIVLTAGGYPYLTVNAYNLWAIIPGNTGNSLASAGLWVCDFAGDAQKCGAGSAVFGGIPAVLVGSVLLLATMALILWVVARRPDRLTVLVGLAVLALAFFVVPTRVHERYGYPFFAVGVILAAVSWRWRWAYVALTAATFANMYVVLTTLYPNNPSVMDWLGIGGAIRSQTGVTIVAIAHVGAFLWAVVQMRGDRRQALADDVALSSQAESVDAWLEDPGAAPVPGPGSTSAPGSDDAWDPVPQPPPGPARARLPTWTARPGFGELGLVGWFRTRLSDAPIRPDRSALLAGERGGRLDRLDLWLVVVLVVASLLLRTFRLAEPYQMHFDEVYHARTATEFLQDWRYGLSHDIYEWTHPHLAKYAMAAGIVLWGEDHVSATSSLGVPVRAAVIEPRRDDALAPGGRAGDRLHIATGSEIRTYDLGTRDLLSVVPADGAVALAFDPTGQRLILGYDDGRIETLDATSLGALGVDLEPEPVALATVDHAVERLLVTNDGASVVAASSGRLSVVALLDGTVSGSLDLPEITDLALGGSGSALIATVADVADPAAAASVLASILAGKAADYQAKLTDPSAGPTVVLGNPGSGDARKALDTAITDGRLTGIGVEDVPRVAVATSDGVAFVDPARASLITTMALDGGAHGLAMVTGVEDPRLYATTGRPDNPGYEVIAIGGDVAKDGPVDQGRHPLPAPATRIVYDDATQMVHLLGKIPGSTGADGDPWTVYVVEPHANAVFADARLPADFAPAAWAADVASAYPSDDRQELLVFTGSGSSASIEIGSHAFAWRLPGVIGGALTAGLLFLLARILFRRRLVAVLTGLFVLVDGMFFVQSRIGMNDVYVGLFIVAAYTLFAAIWTGWLRGRLAFWLGMPVIGVLLGLALASKWVAAYAIGALVLLVLVRSALGRVLTILGLIGLTAVLGYMAISVPEGAGFGNLTFLLIMVALTLIAVVVAVLHPIAWTDDELRFAVLAPSALGIVVFFGALAFGRLQTSLTVGSLAVTPQQLAIALGVGSIAVVGLFWVAGRWGFGPLAEPPGPDDPVRNLEPPAPAPDGWLRPGTALGLPVVWAAACLVVVPIVVYVLSYIPWAMVEGHQLWAGWPPGHTGQNLVDLTAQMYRYHNDLSQAHPASSPWWAWPLDLKPVWFYQDGFAGATSASIYDAGNLVIWWLGIPAMAFAGLMAYKRRSPALALIAVGFAAQWITWARIDRAAFQYHYYTALPFVVLALAYFIAELWHGASRHAWLLARVGAAAALALPALMWVLSRPLCGFVGVLSVNPGSQACPAVIPDFVLTARTAGVTLVVAVGLVALVLRFLEFDARDMRRAVGERSATLGSLARTGAAVIVGLIVVAFLPDNTILTLTNIPVEPIALIVGTPLGYFALQVIGARDPRRFVAGYLVAVVGWFAILYPNIAALPLPAAIVNAYQGILPTYLYAFQFPVSKVDRNVAMPLLTPTLAILLVALVVTCLVVAYSTWVWRLALADSKDPSPLDDPDGRIRTGGA
jgi:C-terminal four TMM region of protein-O-mannosyltransferase/Dolichyl-phosphate-mannose-protein mannosyltransferase